MVPSALYEFEPQTRQLRRTQLFETAGARDFEHYRIGDRHFLAVANFYGRQPADAATSSYSLDSVVYEFDAGDVYSATAAGGVPTGWSASFAPVQKLPTVGASDFESFSVDYRGRLSTIYKFLRLMWGCGSQLLFLW